ncbi:carbon-nitrogen family hydrolase [archaeon]|nr:carbon-nitrogen family hydrolase [archaeon]
MRVTIAQTDIAFGAKEKNLGKALEIVKVAGSDLILFPELFTTGFDFDALKELSEEIPGETTAAIQGVCGDSIVGGSIVEKDKDIYNTFFLLDKDGILGKYRKMHLFRAEKNYFSSGTEPIVIDTKFGKIGLATCYDIRFPELTRELTKNGAEILLVTAEFPSPRDNHWKVLLQARAIENQVFVIATNRVGRDKRQEYFGSSMVIDPWGRVLLEGGSKEEELLCDIDIQMVSKTRKDFPVLGDSKII